MYAQNEALPLRVGYLLQKNGPDLSVLSGPQLHTTAVIQGLRKAGDEVRTVAIQRWQLGWSDDDLKDNWQPPRYGFADRWWFRLVERPLRWLQNHLPLPFLGLFDALRFADAAVQLLRGYDVLYERHGYMGFGGVFAARLLNIPLVLELNGNILKELDEMGLHMSAVQKKIGRWITRHTFLAADHVVVVSEALKHELVDGLQIPAEKISVVLNGVDLELFSQPYDHQAVRQQYHLGAGPVVAFVGSFQPWHGVEFLVAAFKAVQERFPSARLLLVGDGEGRANIMTQLTELGLQDHIVLTGRLPQAQVAAIVQAADVLAAPYGFTYGDIVGTPLKIVEYMAAGKAIVASTAPIHELIADGVTGVRVAPANADALASGIIRLLEDEALRATLGANAQREAQQYSWAHVVNRLRRLFIAELVKRKRRSLIPVTTA